MGKTIRSQISHTSKITRATTTRQDTPRSNVTLTRLPPTPDGREIPTDMAWVNGSHMATGLEKEPPTDMVSGKGSLMVTALEKGIRTATAWGKGTPTDTAWGSGSPMVTD